MNIPAPCPAPSDATEPPSALGAAPCGAGRGKPGGGSENTGVCPAHQRPGSSPEAGPAPQRFTEALPWPWPRLGGSGKAAMQQSQLPRQQQVPGRRGAGRAQSVCSPALALQAQLGQGSARRAALVQAVGSEGFVSLAKYFCSCHPDFCCSCHALTSRTLLHMNREGRVKSSV